jgi:hypothetical protein
MPEFETIEEYLNYLADQRDRRKLRNAIGLGLMISIPCWLILAYVWGCIFWRWL